MKLASLASALAERRRQVCVRGHAAAAAIVGVTVPTWIRLLTESTQAAATRMPDSDDLYSRSKLEAMAATTAEAGQTQEQIEQRRNDVLRDQIVGAILEAGEPIDSAGISAALWLSHGPVHSRKAIEMGIAKACDAGALLRIETDKSRNRPYWPSHVELPGDATVDVEHVERSAERTRYHRAGVVAWIAAQKDWPKVIDEARKAGERARKDAADARNKAFDEQRAIARLNRR